MELEREFDSQVEKLKDDIAKQEEKRKNQNQSRLWKQKLNKAIEDYNKKLIKERDNKEMEFQRILKRIEETEKKKADLEIEQYSNEAKTQSLKRR